jgi:hypothetical protein
MLQDLCIYLLCEVHVFLNSLFKENLTIQAHLTGHVSITSIVYYVTLRFAKAKNVPKIDCFYNSSKII